MTKQRGHKSERKKRKTGLAVTLVLLIACIAVAAVFFLMGQNSEGKKQYEAEIRQEAQKFTDNLISELDQIDTSIDVSEESPDTGAAENNPPSPAEAPAEIITEAEKQVIEDELAKLEDERKQRVLQTLSIAYSKALEQQKQEAFSMADNLIAQAKSDWKAVKSSGKADPVKKSALLSEYLAKSKAMEEQMDASFEALTKKMDEQLRAEEIDPKAIIAQYKAEYKKIKEENKEAMMSKAMAAVKKQ